MRVIDDASVRRLAAIGCLVREFPFLAAKRTVVSRSVRGCCGRPSRPGSSQALDFQRIKQGIGSMTADGQRRVLDALGVAQARLVYRVEGKLVQKIIG